MHLCTVAKVERYTILTRRFVSPGKRPVLDASRRELPLGVEWEPLALRTTVLVRAVPGDAHHRPARRFGGDLRATLQPDRQPIATSGCPDQRKHWGLSGRDDAILAELPPTDVRVQPDGQLAVGDLPLVEIEGRYMRLRDPTRMR